MRNEVITRPERRPCMVHKRRGMFHGWVINGKKEYGMIEFEDGYVRKVRFHKIKFIDSEWLFAEYDWRKT